MSMTDYTRANLSSQQGFTSFILKTTPLLWLIICLRFLPPESTSRKNIPERLETLAPPKSGALAGALSCQEALEMTPNFGVDIFTGNDRLVFFFASGRYAGWNAIDHRIRIRLMEKDQGQATTARSLAQTWVCNAMDS
jgi:hypothetical protein